MGGTSRSLRVFATSAYGEGEPLATFIELAGRDRAKLHRLTEHPEEADIILFVESSHYSDDPYFTVLRKHPLVQAHREKAFMYNEHARPWCVLPGLYTNMPNRWFNPRRQRASGYVRRINGFVGNIPDACKSPKWLYSFVGAARSHTRQQVLNLRHPNGLIDNTSDRFNAFQLSAMDADERSRGQRRYAEILADSKFILCPGGFGASSYRLFEAMESGRVPVIISDQWVEPEGPEWSRFSVRVREADVEGIPSLLESVEPRWREMSVEARSAWEAWFSPEMLFHRMTESCADIFTTRRFPERISRYAPQPAYFEWRARTMWGPYVGRVRNMLTRTN
jgi:hypothetical protein